MVALQGVGEDLHNMEEGAHHQRTEEGPEATMTMAVSRPGIANIQNCHFMYCFFLTQIPEHLYILQKLPYLETIL